MILIRFFSFQTPYWNLLTACVHSESGDVAAAKKFAEMSDFYDVKLTVCLAPYNLILNANNVFDCCKECKS